MAAITKPTAKPSLSSLLPPSVCKLSGLIAGEALDWMDACYIKNSDGKVYKSIGTAANAAAKVRGFAAGPAALGQAVTLLRNVEVGWASAGNAGNDIYVGAVAGGIDSATSTGGTAPIGFFIDASRLFLTGSAY